MDWSQTTSVIRQKDESQNWYSMKTKHTKFPKKLTFLTLSYAHVREGGDGGNVRFSENLVYFVFLKHAFRDSSFCLITDD